MHNFIFQIHYSKTLINEEVFSANYTEIYNNNLYSVHVLGDCIGSIDSSLRFDNNQTLAQWIIDNLKGHFYYIIENLKNNSLVFGSANFNILPLYYHANEKELIVSNSIYDIQKKLSKTTINKRFILENILFNYPLFNETAFKEVKLLPSNSYLELNGNKLGINYLKPIEEYFVSSPIPWKKAVNDISDLFIEKAEQYFPNEKYANSLTGGFDGRTLTALGKHFNKDFTAYSFGSKESKDVQIAQRLSSVAQLDFISLDLDDDYIKNKSLEKGLQFIKGSMGGASFARAHYMNSIQELSKDYRYIITGNFGSEVFRAAHIAGVVISPNLYSLFRTNSFQEGIRLVENSQAFQWLNKATFINEWEELKEDLKTLPCFRNDLKGLTKNEQFYKFVFEEIFRKYFGAEMSNQYQYLINRTPFLDFDFIKAILKTQLSGVYSDFFENNPLKRFKGQVVYAHIIHKTYPTYGKEMTDKGYRPDDLLSLMGKLRIGKSYIRKKVLKKAPAGFDPYSVNGAFASNKAFWQKEKIDNTLFNRELILNAIDTLNNRDSLFVVLSQNYFINFLTQNNATI